jgi:hypothetical protein
MKFSRHRIGGFEGCALYATYRCALHSVDAGSLLLWLIISTLVAVPFVDQSGGILEIGVLDLGCFRDPWRICARSVLN